MTLFVQFLQGYNTIRNNARKKNKKILLKYFGKKKLKAFKIMSSRLFCPNLQYIWAMKGKNVSMNILSMSPYFKIQLYPSVAGIYFSDWFPGHWKVSWWHRHASQPCQPPSGPSNPCPWPGSPFQPCLGPSVCTPAWPWTPHCLGLSPKLPIKIMNDEESPK